MLKKIFIILFCINLLLSNISCSTLKTIPVEQRVDQRKKIYWKNLELDQKINLENKLASNKVYREIINLKDPHDVLSANFITLASLSDIDKYPGAKIIGTLHSKSYIHIVTQVGRKIQKLADLRGKKICCGELNSITTIDAINVFVSEKKITGVDLTCENCSLTDQPKKLISKDIDAFIVTGKIPCPIVTEVVKVGNFILIPIPRANFFKIQNISSMLYERGEIDLYDYTNRSEDKGNIVETLCRINLVVASEESDDEVVYQVTGALYNILPEHHKQLLVSNWPQIESYQISRLALPFHPAAKKFYYEEIERAKLEPWYKDKKIYAIGLTLLAILASGNRRGDEGGAAGGGGGCFIATAAYGTPMANQVKILCEFRDRYLLNNFIGREFVKTYYKYSPTMADFIVQHEKIRFVCRLLLLPLIGYSYFMIHVGIFLK